MMRRQSSIFYLSIIIVYNIVIINCEIWDDNDPDTVSNIPEASLLLQSQNIMLTSDNGSGITELSSEMPMTSIETIILETEDTSINATTSFTTITTTIASNGTQPTPINSTTVFYFKNCNDTSSIWWNHNDTCIPTNSARKNAVKTIRSSSSDSDEKADALILYFRLTDDLTTISNLSDILTPREIDELIDGLNDIRIKNFSTFLIISQSTIDGSIGFSSKYNSTKEVIQNTTKMHVINSNVSAAALINDQSINGVSNIKAVIVDEPTAYRTFNSSNNHSVVSSVIIASVNRKDDRSVINISLYFQVLHEDKSHINGRYSCSFLDTNTSTWNQSGCSETLYNKTFDRYECTCNHLTTFALIWLPNTPQSNYLTSQDIASLVFLSISILCFIAVIMHSLCSRLCNPIISLQPRDLLPLISSASTTILFIFYIALTMTVYTRISSPSSSSISTPCFFSSSVLMFVVYFFLIFMFCVKTSVGYFNYLRFVHLFPEPSYKKLFLLLIISFFISITWTSFAVGFNSNTSFHITQLHGNKICWFTRNVIYYFMTIPVGIFLLLNLITIIFVAKHIIRHARNATTRHTSHKRMRRCVLVLLSSCVAQGIGWLFGPFISFVNPTGADILGWLFVIFNGLEGVWTILLYIIILCQRMDEPKRVSDSRKRRVEKIPSISDKIDLNRLLERRFRNTRRNQRKKNIVFHDLYNEESIDLRNKYL